MKYIFILFFILIAGFSVFGRPQSAFACGGGGWSFYENPDCPGSDAPPSSNNYVYCTASQIFAGGWYSIPCSSTGGQDQYYSGYCQYSAACATPPNCNTGGVCTTCNGAGANTCSNNGTYTCSYYSYTGGGSCTTTKYLGPAACTVNNCSSGYTCVSGSCVVNCAPNWSCTGWTPSTSSTSCGLTFNQTQTCTDSNSCGTLTGKPSVSRSSIGTQCPVSTSGSCTYSNSCDTTGDITTTSYNSCNTSTGSCTASASTAYNVSSCNRNTSATLTTISCTSAANVCGQTSSGKYKCDGTCSATAPAPTCDTTPPTVGSITSMPVVQNTSTIFSVTVSDNVGVTWCVLNVNNSAVADMAVPGSIAFANYTFAAAGSYQMRAICGDAAGNSTNGANKFVTVAAKICNPGATRYVCSNTSCSSPQ